MTRRFPRAARVRTRAEYDRIFQHGRRVALPVLALHWRPAFAPPAVAHGIEPQPGASAPPAAAAAPSQTDASAPGADAGMPAGRAGSTSMPERGPGRSAESATQSALPPQDRPSGREATPVATASPDAGARLGLAVSRKVDRRAVVRNRIKRGLREMFRAHRAELMPGDYVVVARPGAAALNTQALQGALLTLLRRCGALPPVSPAGTMPAPACTDRVQSPPR